MKEPEKANQEISVENNMSKLCYAKKLNSHYKKDYNGVHYLIQRPTTSCAPNYRP